MSSKCEECDNAKFIEGYEQDPICKISDGIECARKGTWRSFKKREGYLILEKGGIGAMLNEIERVFDEF